MAMADEMGEGEGDDGGDDGFVDCAGGEGVKRRSKKRTGVLCVCVVLCASPGSFVGFFPPTKEAGDGASVCMCCVFVCISVVYMYVCVIYMYISRWMAILMDEAGN